MMTLQRHAHQRQLCVGLLLAFAALSGCATVGSGDFACPGRPTGVRCASASEVYAMTEGADQIRSTSDQILGDDPSRAVKARRQQAEHAVNASKEAGATPQDGQQATPVPEMRRDPMDGELLQASTRAVPILPLVHKPIPVRTPAQVMRVWIAPWEDEKGVLHIGGYHFVEIQARRWSFGEQNVFEPVRLFSIQEPFPDSVNAGGKTQAAQPVAAQPGDSEHRKRP